jgi:hypothetical protein
MVTSYVTHYSFHVLWYNAFCARVLLNGRALAFQAKDTGSIPVARSGPIAQWLEQPASLDRAAKSTLDTLVCQGAVYRETGRCLPVKFGEA